MSPILGIDTTNQYSSVAVVEDARILAYSKKNIGRGHAEVLAPQVQNALQTAGLTPADISRIAVCTGPGSFTGVRVGLSFAKGFALPRATPIIGISGLAVMAAMTDPTQDQRIIAIQDVKRGEVFWQIFDHGHPVDRPRLTPIDGAKNAAKPTDLVVGSGATLIGQDAKITTVNPAVLAWLAATHTPTSSPAEPLYHRPPDAKLPGGRTL